MYVTTTLSHHGQVEVLTYQVTRVRQVLAQYLAQRPCGCAPGSPARFCLVDPPGWMWSAGLTSRLSLGRLVFDIGQWAHGREFAELRGQRLVRREIISRADAIEHYGWTEQVFEQIDMLD